MSSPEIPSFEVVHKNLDENIFQKIEAFKKIYLLNKYSQIFDIDDIIWSLEIEVYNKTIAACQKFLLETLESRKTDESGKSKERR